MDQSHPAQQPAPPVSSAAAAPFPSHLVELPESECWRLLGTRPVGRLAWVGSEGLTVIPVNYELRDRTLVIRTTSYSTTAREVDDSPVAFEVDEVDEPSHQGWSVLVRGHARLHYATLTAEGPTTWRGGINRLQIEVPVERITGRALLGH